jgi:hypothetical protein
LLSFWLVTSALAFSYSGNKIKSFWGVKSDLKSAGKSNIFDCSVIV